MSGKLGPHPLRKALFLLFLRGPSSFSCVTPPCRRQFPPAVTRQSLFCRTRSTRCRNPLDCRRAPSFVGRTCANVLDASATHWRPVVSGGVFVLSLQSRQGVMRIVRSRSGWRSTTHPVRFSGRGGGLGKNPMFEVGESLLKAAQRNDDELGKCVFPPIWCCAPTHTIT